MNNPAFAGIAPGFPGAMPMTAANAAPTGGGFPAPGTPPPQHPQNAVGGAVHSQPPQPAAQPMVDGVPPQAVAFRHRTTGQTYDLNAAFAKSPEVYPVDASGNEVFNMPGMAGAQQRPDMPQQTTMAGFATSQEVAMLRSEVEALRQQLSQTQAALSVVQGAQQRG